MMSSTRTACLSAQQTDRQTVNQSVDQTDRQTVNQSISQAVRTDGRSDLPVILSVGLAWRAEKKHKKLNELQSNSWFSVVLSPYWTFRGCELVLHNASPKHTILTLRRYPVSLLYNAVVTFSDLNGVFTQADETVQRRVGSRLHFAFATWTGTGGEN